MCFPFHKTDDVYYKVNDSWRKKENFSFFKEMKKTNNINLLDSNDSIVILDNKYLQTDITSWLLIHRRIYVQDAELLDFGTISKMVFVQPIMDLQKRAC